jgi:chromosome transmission fidelity protein 18
MAPSADGPQDAGVLSSAARGDLMHFSPSTGTAAAAGGFDLGNSLSGLAGVLKRKVDDPSATPGAPAATGASGDMGGGALAPQKQQQSSQMPMPMPDEEDGPPPGFDDMPEEPDWDEMAMMEAEAQSFADMQEPPTDILAEDSTAAPQAEPAGSKRAASAAVEDSLFDDFDAPVVQSQPVPKRPRTAPKPTRQYVHRIEPSGGTVAVTNTDGIRVFIKTLPRAGVPSPQSVVARGSDNVTLTGEPFEEMVREAEASLHRKQVEDAVAVDEGEVDKENDGDTAATPARKQLEDSLWVDRYRPSRFTELMSNGKANRNVLLWLTQWRNFIEGKGPDPKRRPEVRRNVKFDRKGQNDEGGGDGKFESKFRKPWEQDTLEEPDEDGRPGCKLLLLAGPPGLGKTTMAHVLAQHAGFEVIEINASDERTADGLRERVENATQMRSVLHGQPGYDAKPNAIILDEIDGAMEGRDGRGAITELLKLAAGEGRKAGSQGAKKDGGRDAAGSEDEEGDDGPGKTAKKKSSTPKLSRPIICICNDLWAPSLKALRDVARVFQFLPTPPRTMAKRLTEICRKEGMEPDRGAIMQVVEIADGDIRSALNTLQFMQRKFGRISRDAITMAAVGHKDVGVTNFQLWRRIFGESMQAKAKALSAGLGSATTAAAQREELYELKQMVESSSNMNQLLEGCHANCFTAASSWTTHDTTMAKTAQLCDWLVFAETIRLERFIVPAVMAFHHTCKAGTGITPKVNMPKAEREARLLKTSNVNVLDSFLVGVGQRSVTARRALSRAMCAVETIPGLTYILRPLPLTNSGSHGGAVGRLSDVETGALRSLVSVMHDYGLAYQQKFTHESGAALELQPPIHALAGYSGMAVRACHAMPCLDTASRILYVVVCGHC